MKKSVKGRLTTFRGRLYIECLLIHLITFHGTTKKRRQTDCDPRRGHCRVCEAWRVVTPTSAVSSKAGVAEGTLFTYFPTKEALMNGLYRALKLDLAAAMLPGLPKKRDARRQYRHIWECYVHWGVKHPDKFKV